MRYYIGGARRERFVSATDILYTVPFAGVEDRGLFADNFFMFELCWRYQFSKKYPIYFSIFADGGNLWNYAKKSGSGEKMSESFFRNLPVGIETELAMKIPVGPVRFSWSRLISGEFYENFGLSRKNIFRFSAGFDF
jgi:outer membrane protein assembly factor BamA